MVNTIDGDARRRALAEAVWRIVQRDGLAAASVRNVARESGLSAGSVRHFFDTQQSLIAFAMRELIDTVAARVRAEAATGTAEERALAAVVQLVPLTDASRDEAAAHLEFVTAARLDPGLAAIAAESFAGIRTVCEQAVRLLVEEGRLTRGTDVPERGLLLAAVVDGLTFRLVTDPGRPDPDQVRALLRRTLLEDAS